MPFLPTYIGKGTFQGNAAALTVPLPTGVRNNDLLLLFVESANEAIATPAGWTQVTNSPQATGTAATAGGVRLAVFWRLWSGPEASVTVADTGNHQTAIIMAYRGVDPSNPFDVTAGSVGAATTSMVFPTVTTTVANTLIVLASASDADLASTTTMGTITNANLSGITEDHDETIIAGTGGGLGIAHGSKATAGATGTSTATSSTSVTHAYMTIALKGMEPLVRAVAQYEADDTTLISTGGTSTNGLTDGVTLVAEYSSGFYPDDPVTPKLEVQQTTTSFTNSATTTLTPMTQESDDYNYGGRGGSMIHDTLNDRYIYFGGYDGTTRFNHTYSLDMRTPGNPWRKMAPTGTLPAGRNLGAITYVQGITSGSVEKAYLVIWGGYQSGGDSNDMWTLDVTTPGSEAWAQVTQTSALSARSYNMRHMVSTPVSGDTSQNYIYLFGGWAGTPRTNVLVRATFDVDSPTAVTWTTLKAEGAGGNPTIREGAILDYKASTGKLYLYGGYSGTAYLTDFWEYDIAGNSWSQRTVTGTAPAGTDLGAGGYDSINNRFWFTGGWTAGAATSGSNQVGYISDVGGSEAFVIVRANSATNQSYPGNSSTTNTVDNKRGWLVLHGMATTDSTERFSYIIDFRETATSNFPVYGLAEGDYFSARDATATIYNPDRNEIIAIGGLGNFPDEATITLGSHSTEVWTYNPTDNTWRFAVKGYKTINSLEGISGCYDTTRDRFLIYGGLNGAEVYSNEVWSLTADAAGYYTVKRLNPTGTPPFPKWLGASAYDAVNDRMITTMGGDSSTVTNQVWELSFTSSAEGVWTQRTPSGSVTAVIGCGYDTDTANNRLYIFGGATNTSLTTTVNQTIYLNMATTNCAWTTLTATNGTARRTPSFGFDPVNNKLLAFGGFNGSIVLTNTQYYDVAAGTGWTTALTTLDPQPEARRSAGGAFANGKLIIHSGRPNTGIWHKNTWELTPNYTTPASSTWLNKTPRIFNRMSFDYTPPTNNANYHWQVWATEGSIDASVALYASNSPDIDFVIGTPSGGAVGYKKVLVAGVWTAKPVKYWNGSAWVQKPQKYWNGSAWVTSDA